MNITLQKSFYEKGMGKLLLVVQELSLARTLETIMAIVKKADSKEECLAVGMDDYVSKPVRMDALTESLSKCTKVKTIR